MQDDAGLIRFHHQPFWNTKFCAAHEGDGTPRCHACNRLQTRGDRTLVHMLCIHAVL